MVKEALASTKLWEARYESYKCCINVYKLYYNIYGMVFGIVALVYWCPFHHLL